MLPLRNPNFLTQLDQIVTISFNFDIFREIAVMWKINVSIVQSGISKGNLQHFVKISCVTPLNILWPIIFPFRDLRYVEVLLVILENSICHKFCIIGQSFMLGFLLAKYSCSHCLSYSLVICISLSLYI